MVSINNVSYSAALNQETESVPKTYNRQCVVHTEPAACKPSEDSYSVLKKMGGVLDETPGAKQPPSFSFFLHHIRIENMKQYETTLNKSDKQKIEGKEMKY